MANTITIEVDERLADVAEAIEDVFENIIDAVDSTGFDDDEHMDDKLRYFFSKSFFYKTVLPKYYESPKRSWEKNVDEFNKKQQAIRQAKAKAKNKRKR